MDAERRSILLSLLALDRPVEQIASMLAKLKWNHPSGLVLLTREHISDVLERFRARQVSAETVEAWADLIEYRDDISFANQSVVDAIFVLANPKINGPLDDKAVEEILAQTSNETEH